MSSQERCKAKKGVQLRDVSTLERFPPIKEVSVLKRFLSVFGEEVGRSVVWFSELYVLNKLSAYNGFTTNHLAFTVISFQCTCVLYWLAWGCASYWIEQSHQSTYDNWNIHCHFLKMVRILFTHIFFILVILLIPYLSVTGHFCHFVNLILMSCENLGVKMCQVFNHAQILSWLLTVCTMKRWDY